jgi:CMP-N,N'-diacetyllegionaminic acid synthase
MRILYLITARAGSKGLPGKNIKMLGNKPLIQYSIDFALKNMNPKDVLCVSTNDDQILDLLFKSKIEIPFKRPEELSSDTAGSYEVIMHALNHYEMNDAVFDAVLLLQPTSPLRHQEDIANLFETYDEECDMVVSVKKSKESPYYTIFEENQDNFLERSKKSNFTRRQDCPEVFTYNGSMYLMRVASLKKESISDFKKIKKIIMPEERSIDIDTMADWVLTEYYLTESEKY